MIFGAVYLIFWLMQHPKLLAILKFFMLKSIAMSIEYAGIYSYWVDNFWQIFFLFQKDSIEICKHQNFWNEFLLIT